MDDTRESRSHLHNMFQQKKDAKRIAKQLVSEKLAFCVNIIPGGISIYQDGDELVEAEEYYLFIKAMDGKVMDIMTQLPSIHPYQDPAVVCIKASTTEGFFKFLKDNK